MCAAEERNKLNENEKKTELQEEMAQELFCATSRKWENKNINGFPVFGVECNILFSWEHILLLLELLTISRLAPG